MQDIVFYVAANETLGRVRDYSNMRNSGAPLLTLGVAVCLRMRLFEDIEDSTPYPIDSFSGITDWQWRMDADFDRSTACKLVADADGISVHNNRYRQRRDHEFYGICDSDFQYEHGRTCSVARHR